MMKSRQIILVGFLLLWSAFAASAAPPDVFVALNETAANEAAQQLIGLEIKLSNGAQLRLASVTLALQPQQAAFQLGVQARAANTMGLPLNLTLKGLIREGVRAESHFSLPVELTEVTLANGVLTPLLKVFLGDWLTPARWQAAIPALNLPATINQTVNIPATTVEVAGTLPMTVNTQALQVPLHLTLAQIAFAEKHLNIALQFADNAEPASLEVAQDAAPTPFALGLSRRALGALLQAFANANANDFNLRLKPARIRQEQIDALVKVTNYTDVESGEGQADLKQIAVEQLRDNLLVARLLAQGNFNARVNGREYGIPYRLSPRGEFGVLDRLVNLRLLSDNGAVWLQALPGAQLPVDLHLNIPLVGRAVGINRQIQLPAERVFNRWELPALWAREFALPRKLNVQADKSLQIAETQPLTLSLAQIQAQTRNDAFVLSATVAFRKD